MADSGAFDCIVIGGGINGTGVARDLALRGHRVALFERNDLGFGASGNSSGMIHGGPRYLTAHPEVTRASCVDSGHIQRIAPHLLFRVPFLVPAKSAGEQLLHDAFFRAYDRYQPLKRSREHYTFDAKEVESLEPGLVETKGAVCFDEWGVDGVRLCVLNMLDAVARGASYFHRSTVEELLRDGNGAVLGVRYQNRETGAFGEARAPFVVNASGAWSNEVARKLGLPRKAPLVRPGKGIHVYLDRRLSNFAIVTNAIDGRQVFLLPWQNTSVLGTTDTDYYGDPDRVVANEDEVGYLFEAIAGVFPAVRSARAIGTWGGLRPTIFDWGPSPDRLSREHRIVEHGSDGVSGVYSMIGGKLASYRLFAEEMSDEIDRRLGGRGRCQTAVLALPGGTDRPSEKELAAASGMTSLGARRLVYRQGQRAHLALEVNGAAEVVCPCEPVSEAEIRFVIRSEWATSVADVARRTRLGLGACGGILCAVRAGAILAEELGRDAEFGRESARDFLGEAAERRRAIQGPLQRPTEELVRDLGAERLGFKHPFLSK